MKTATALIQSTTMMSSLATVVARSTTAAAFVARSSRSFTSATALRAAKAGQAEVVLVGCGAPNRGTIVYQRDPKDVGVARVSTSWCANRGRSCV
jgi:hypothetical protein